MRQSRVLKKLRSGEFASCFKINIADGRSVEIAALSGFDCVWLDNEHIAQNWSVLQSQIWAAQAHDVDVMVRVSRGGYSEYIKPLELNASGILVPHVLSLADAQNIVRFTKFHPAGRRPIDGGSADGEYASADLTAYMRFSNEEKFLALQIEDPEVIPDLDAIAALDGVDMLFFGPGDFSQGIGAPGNWDHPELITARQMVADAARRHGKFAATSAGIDALEELRSVGYHFVNTGADVVGLSQYCRSITERISKLNSASANSGTLNTTTNSGRIKGESATSAKKPY